MTQTTTTTALSASPVVRPLQRAGGRRPLKRANHRIGTVGLLVAALLSLGGTSRVYDSGNYRVHSDLPADLTRDLARELERCHADYSRRLGLFARDGAADGGGYDVHLFADRRDYDQFTGGVLPNSAGAFHSGRRALCAFLEGQGRGELRRTLRHEAFHQFAHERIGPTLPLWVNEGLAQIFEFGVRCGDELLMGQVPPAALREVRAIVEANGLIDFASLLEMDERAWHAAMADPRAGAVLYAQSWAMVHFLAYATGDDGRPLYRERLLAFLSDAADGTPGGEAFRRHFGTNLAGFRGRFETFVETLRPTAAAVALDEQDVLARMLILLARDGTSFGDVDEFREYAVSRGVVLHRTRNNVAWRTAADPSVYFPAGGRLRFERDAGAPLPALVRRPGDGRVYTTRFYELGGELRHETLVTRG